MIYRMYWVVFVALMALPAGAQDRGVLAIDEEAGRHAFSFDSEADALNMCGTTGCEVVATFSACLAVAYSRVMISRSSSYGPGSKRIRRGPPDVERSTSASGPEVRRAKYSTSTVQRPRRPRAPHPPPRKKRRRLPRSRRACSGSRS